MLKKLQKDIKKYFSSPQHVRTISIVALLIIIIAIPLTVTVVQQQQDIRQKAAGSGFKSVETAGCGEVISAPAVGALEGDIVFKAPKKVNEEWQTVTSGGTTFTQEQIADGIYEQWGREFPRDAIAARHIGPFTLTCVIQIFFDGKTKIKVDWPDPQKGKNSENPLFEQETQTLHIKNNGSGGDGNIHAEVRVRVAPSTTVAPTPVLTGEPTPGVASCEDFDGGLIYKTEATVGGKDGYGRYYTGHDYCIGTTLVEYTCDQGDMLSVGYVCPDGCSEGKCNGSPGQGSYCATDADCTGGQYCPAQSGIKVCQPPNAIPTSSITPEEPTGEPTTAPSPTLTGTQSPTPTVITTVAPTPTGTRTPTPTKTPTPTVPLSPTPPSTPTQLSVILTLPGIGSNGNVSPNNAQRRVFIQLFDSANKSVGASVAAQASFDPGSSTFRGTANFGSVVYSGSYIPKIKVDQYLVKKIAPIQITAGTTTGFPPTILIGGDINNDNKIDIKDYNILVSCFGEKINSTTCGLQKVDADLNDDGVIDGVDYNLFISGIKTAKVGD